MLIKYNFFIKKTIFLALFIFSSAICFGQDKDIIIKNIRSFNFTEAKSNLNLLKEKDSLLYRELSNNILLNKNRGLRIKSSTSCKIGVIKLVSDENDYLTALSYLNSGLFEFYYNENSDNTIFTYFNIALNKSLSIDNKPLICETIKGILNYYMTIVNLQDTTYNKYLDIYKKNFYDKTEEDIYNYYKNIIPFEKSSDSKTINYLIPKIFELSKKIKLKPYLGRIYSRIGDYYRFEKKQIDSAKYYYKKSVDLFDLPTEGYLIEQYIKSSSNYARILTEFKQYKKSNSILYAVRDNYQGKLQKRNTVYINYYLAFNYKKSKQMDSAFYYLNKSRLLEYSLNQKQHLATISDINTKYQTEKKEIENLQLKTTVEEEQRQKHNLWVGSLSLLFFGGISTILFLKNSKKKRLLAEQQQEIEKQKVSTLLKEQEISSINAMVEGQEKERKRIAEDLHDDIGSILTTVKLHFENFKLNKKKKKFDEEELITKTDSLLDEAYLKVRNMAHTKNSGVIANQGLLVAIENMAEKISASKKITIEVSAHGLNNRLENSLELNIFRIIQELITNIVKHAQATQAGIHLTNHEQSLNIMVEDNGIGFNVKKISKKGMGIHSIERRIEHLDGTMTIESELNRGTTIIIDIPL